MYSCWAQKRKMKFRELKDQSGQKEYAFRGFGAYAILQAEAGIHVWEVPTNGKKRERIRAYVEVIPQGVIYQEQDLAQYADRLFQESDHSPKIVVRTYRAAPSPLVKDNQRSWRTGLLQRVLNGDFDLFD